MWLYYFKLGIISLRRNPVLTALMILTLAAGVAASVSTLTILNGMSGDPIPHKSDRLLVPLLDNQPLGNDNPNNDPPRQLTWRDAEALWTAAKGARQTPLWGLSPSIDPGRKDMPLFFTDGLAVGRDFFAMFETPMIHGAAWSVEDDQRGAQLTVISRALAERLFTSPAEAVGKTVRMDGHDFQVVGVFADWAPIPKYYRLIGGNYFEGSEDVFIPIRAAINLNLDFDGSINCFANPEEPGMAGLLKSECIMIQYWVEVEDEAGRRVYSDYLEAYVREQKALGRFPKEINNRVLAVGWIPAGLCDQYHQFVAGQVQLAARRYRRAPCSRGLTWRGISSVPAGSGCPWFGRLGPGVGADGRHSRLRAPFRSQYGPGGAARLVHPGQCLAGVDGRGPVGRAAAHLACLSGQARAATEEPIG